MFEEPKSTMVKNNKQVLTHQQEQEQITIPQEVIAKYDGDTELVQNLMSHGYTVEELQGATVTHPTKNDPIATLEDGHVAVMWIGKALPTVNDYYKFTYG